MSVDLFATRELLKTVFALHELKTPFIDTFFNETKQSDSEYIDIDFVEGTRKLAPFASASTKGKMIEKKAWVTKTVRPPYIKILDVTEAAQVLNRLPGENIYAKPQTPKQRARKVLTEELSKFMDMIKRRREVMAHQALTTYGDITYTGEGFSLTVNFGMKSTHKISLTTTSAWSDITNSTPLADIRDWAALLKKDSGLVADRLILDEYAMALFLDHPTITGSSSVLDTRRVDLGKIDPKMLPNGLEYVGTLKRPKIDLYTYSEYYEADNGTVTPVMPSGTAVMGSTRARCVNLFGAIKDLKANASVPMFPKSWEEENPSAQMLLLQSAVLEAPFQIDAFVSVDVDA